MHGFTMGSVANDARWSLPPPLGLSVSFDRRGVPVLIHSRLGPRARDLAPRGGDNRAEAEIETDRYIVLSSRALCYTLGQREIMRRRRNAIATADATP
jgi:hypothetical protein